MALFWSTGLVSLQTKGCQQVAAAPGIELCLHENLFRAFVEVCKVSAACQWYTWKYSYFNSADLSLHKIHISELQLDYLHRSGYHQQICSAQPLTFHTDTKVL